MGWEHSAFVQQIWSRTRVGRESTRIDSMVMPWSSPTLAPSTATGHVTLCPPRNSGVIIGPQQPGGTTQRMCPPSLIVAAKPRLGPMKPPVYSSTKTSSLMSLSIVCMRVLSENISNVLSLPRTCPSVDGYLRPLDRRPLCEAGRFQRRMNA